MMTVVLRAASAVSFLNAISVQVGWIKIKDSAAEVAEMGPGAAKLLITACCLTYGVCWLILSHLLDKDR